MIYQSNSDLCETNLCIPCNGKGFVVSHGAVCPKCVGTGKRQPINMARAIICAIIAIPFVVLLLV